MMIKSDRLSTVLTVVVLLVGVVLLGKALGMLHQGEELYWSGKVVIWCGYAAILASMTAAIAVFVSTRVAWWAALIALLFAMPIGVVTIAPAIWCVFLHCSDSNSNSAPLHLQAVFLFMPQTAALLLLRYRTS